MDTSLSLATAYADLRATIDSLVAKLGGDNFAISAVTVGAREALQFVTPSAWRRGFRSHMPFCEALTASPEQLQAASERLTRMFSIREGAASHRGALGSGWLTVRGNTLCFETEEAACLFGHHYRDSLNTEKWSAALTSEAEMFLSEHGMDKPSVSLTHMKSEEAAGKALLRFAAQHFHVTLEKVAAAT